MDREWGSKPGSGGAASAQNEAIDRRERLRRLALETIDLAKDPYFMRNHLGRYSGASIFCRCTAAVQPVVNVRTFCFNFAAMNANFV